MISTINHDLIVHRVTRRDLHNARAVLRGVAAVYFLYDSRHSRRYPVYIGQSDNAYRRLRQHRRQRANWDLALIVATADRQRPFTLTSIHYLEARLLAIARRRRRVARRLQNQVIPAVVYAPPSLLRCLDRHLVTLAAILASGPTGHPPDKPQNAGQSAGRALTCQLSQRGHPRGHPPEAPPGHPPYKPVNAKPWARLVCQPVSHCRPPKRETAGLSPPKPP